MATATRTITRYRSRPKKKARRRAKFTLPIAITIPVASQAITLGKLALDTSPQNAMAVAGRYYTGFDTRDHKFHMDGLKAGLLPLLMGITVHKLAGAVGINRALGRAKVPWIRI